MSFTPYITFQGNCAEAMAFYAEVFDAELTLFRFRDMPDAPQEFAECDLVMNSELKTLSGSMFASDYPPGAEGDPQAGISISHDVPDLAQARAIYDRLAEGGHVIMPFEPTFWSPGFGMVKDRFGTDWMISVPNPA